MNTFLQDLRYGFRMLRKSPGFTVVAVLTLALGIGVNTAMFSVVQGVLLSALPYSHPDHLVLVMESNQRFAEDAISYPNFQDWKRATHSFENMSAFMVQQEFNLTSLGTPEHLQGYRISSGFFATLRLPLTLGREFSPDEDRQGGAPAIIISNRLWRERFAHSRQIIGKSVTLDGVSYSVIGVAPAGFRLLAEREDIYAPLGQGDPLILQARGSHSEMIALARLAPGMSIGQARTEMNTIQERLDRLYPEANRGTGATVLPLKKTIIGDVSGTILLLMSAVGLVLLIACANVANLLLARSASRRREFAVRSALGAPRARIIRQLVTEGVLLSLAGGVLGLLIAKWCTGLALAVAPLSLPRAQNIGVNGVVLAFTLAISVFIGVLFSLAPALRMSKLDLQTRLKESSKSATAAHYHAQNNLVIVEIALTLVLLAGAGLLFRTMRNLWRTNPGFDVSQLITFKVGLSPSLTQNGATLRGAVLQMLDRIRVVPGVQAADFTMIVPLSREDNDNPFWIGADKPAEIQNAPRTLVFDTGPDYLRTMDIPLLRERFFTERDTQNSPCVTVIDSDFARTYFPGKNPVGRTMTFGFPLLPWGPCQIVGVVGHVRHWGLDESDNLTKAQSYFPLDQAPDNLWPLVYSDLKIVVRTPLSAAAVMPAIKKTVYGSSGGQSVYDVRTLRQIAGESMSAQRFPMILLGVFAALALLLASVGVYGTVAYSVSQRTQEIGVRMALGAQRRAIFRMIVGQGLRLAGGGVALGAAASLILARVLPSFSRLLYGVKGNDPITLIAVALALTGIVVFACYIPARRATRVDPMVALRWE